MKSAGYESFHNPVYVWVISVIRYLTAVGNQWGRPTRRRADPATPLRSDPWPSSWPLYKTRYLESRSLGRFLLPGAALQCSRLAGSTSALHNHTYYLQPLLRYHQFSPSVKSAAKPAFSTFRTPLKWRTPKPSQIGTIIEGIPMHTAIQRENHNQGKNRCHFLEQCVIGYVR